MQAQIEPGQVWEALGGTDGGAPESFAKLVDAFYAQVEQNERLAPLYPVNDADAMTEARENLALFLIQYFGGPAIYAEKRGHPRLRMRHLPYAIGPEESAAWLDCMNHAVKEVAALAPVASLLGDYFERAAVFLQNQPNQPR